MQTKETHWRTAEVLVPHANHWQIIWRSTENLWRNDWKTTEVPAPHIPHRRAEEPLKNCTGATQHHIHPQKNPQRCDYLMEHRQPPKNSWGTTEEPLRCWHLTHPREPLRNQWGTTEILYSSTTTSNRLSHWWKYILVLGSCIMNVLQDNCQFIKI